MIKSEHEIDSKKSVRTFECGEVRFIPYRKTRQSLVSIVLKNRDAPALRFIL